jgi:hypothetical protein
MPQKTNRQQRKLSAVRKGESGSTELESKLGEGSLVSLRRARLSEAGLSAHGCAKRDGSMCSSDERAGITHPLAAGHSEKEQDKGPRQAPICRDDLWPE